MTATPDIAIIGAGAAGIAAARRLAGTGRSVLVLEALPRLGGRAWTHTASGLPLDLGCGWLHSAERNPWTSIAEATGFAIDRSTPAWGTQYRDLGFPAPDRIAARKSFAALEERLATTPPASDVAADALAPGEPWAPYLHALSGFINGDGLARISARDYAAYDTAATETNWRVPAGYGALVAASLPPSATLHLATPIEAIALDGARVALRTPAGTVRARAAIVTIPTNILAGTAIAWPAALDPWREAAARLPLGHNEKLFLDILAGHDFAPETHVIGNPHDAATGAYYIRPFARPVIECFLGGAGAQLAAEQGRDAAFARAIDQLAALFGNGVRTRLRPLAASDWAGTPAIGGGYSHALPGHAAARETLARPFDSRLFFAGEATHPTDFSTAHGAYASGVRAAEEALAALAPTAT